MDQNNVIAFFVEIEKKWLDHWYTNGVIDKYLHKNDDAQDRYSFMDGPITANNPMGVHHAWGRTYKDLWQKFFNLKGKKQRFQNGFDCQGLWVEVEVEKELGLKSKKDIENLVPGDKHASIAKFVQMCKDRVIKFSGIQTEQSKRLGYFMDWEHSYFTMHEDNNYMIWHFLKTCYENGWIYKGHESVPWCPRCETAISQHEMLTEDYKEVVHESIYFALPIISDVETHHDASLLVWTTTPWTLPANIAVAVDNNLDYALVEDNGNHYWVVKDAAERIFKAPTIKKTVKGKELVGLKYKAPFDELEAVQEVAEKNKEKFHTVIATDPLIMPISTTEGTGMVHTAVSAGTEDFKLGKKYGLPMIPVIADNADYLPGLGFLSGKNAKKHPEIILDYLKEQTNHKTPWVYKIERYKHRYPGCWRCKAELVWKVADEWYIAMDLPVQLKDKSEKIEDARTLRERMIDVAKKISWMPEFGLDRELDWLNNMHDWLISKKNRFWGLALPIYECVECKTFEVIGSKEELKKRAVSGGDTFEGHTPHKPYIDDVIIACSTCGKSVRRVADVGNPWLDAGIVPYSTIKDHNQGEPLYLSDRKEWQQWFPVDFITESFPGQFKNWFYAMIAMSTVLEDTNPFKQVLGFGTLVGEDGRPMHKSWGNSIEFNEGADNIGVDVMRWMYARHNPADNLLFGPNKASEVRRQFYLLLWNIFKFYRDYAELDGYTSQKGEPVSGHVLDQWILSRFAELNIEVNQNLQKFNAKDAALAIEAFVQDFSTWYIRRSRDRVGPAVEDEEDKKSFYHTTEFVLTNLSIMLSPFMPFLPEEVYTQLTKKESVHLESWPALSVKLDSHLNADISKVRTFVEAGHRVRKELKLKVRQPLANVIIGRAKTMEYAMAENIDKYNQLIKEELNVKKVAYIISKEEVTVEYDTTITPELKVEGEVRDLIRTIQQQRKTLGVNIAEKIRLTVPEAFAAYKEYLQKQVQAEHISFGPELKVEKV